MEKTYSAVEPPRISYHPQHDGTAVVLLHENIEKDYYDHPDGTSDEFWTADEVCVVTDLAESEIEANFDALWVNGETSGKTLEERVSELEALLGDTIDTILEGGEQQ